MAKKGVLRITGNTSPKTGVKTFYKVTEWYPDTPLSERKESLVTWELFRKRENGKFTTTTIKKQGINHFTFGKDAWKYTFRVEGYLHGPEGKEPMSIIVKPQKNEQQAAPKEKDILGVKLTFQDGTPINKKLSYKDRLWATAKCQGMEGEYITFSLWEDDEIGEGHNKKNQFILKSTPVQVDSKGYARWNFALLNTYITIANKREDDKKKHEYYVTAEYNGKLKASDNAHANNPEYKAPPKKPTGNNGGKPQPKPAPPKPKPDSPKGSTRPNSPNNQPDKNGKITKVKLTDKNGKEFTKNPKFGETIRVSIDSYNLVGKKYTLKIWEHDLIGDDLLYNKEHTFLTNHVDVFIPLTKQMQKTGEIGSDPKNPDSGEYWKGGQQEIFAEVILLNIKSESQTIDVDIMEAPKKQDDGVTPTKKEKTNISVPNTTCLCKQYDLILGNKVNCAFRKKVVEISKALWGEAKKIEMANNLMVIMYFETAKTFSPSKQNSRGFTGLIQFGTDSSSDLGTTTDKLKKMSAIEQLDYVKKYFEQTVFKGKINNLLDMYLAINYPAMIKNNKTGGNNILYSAPSIQYHTNYSFMKESGEHDNIVGEEIINGKKIIKRGFKDGHTYVWEVDKVMKEWYEKYKSEKWNQKCEDIPATEEKISTGGCFQNVVKDGYLIDSKIEIYKKGTTPAIDKDIKIIVLHRTHYNLKNNVKNLITNNKYPVHFWVNGDGKIYQQTSLNNRSHHIGVAQKAHTKANKWGNNNSISIEVNGKYLDKNGKRADREVAGGYWEDVTKEQAQSVACLVSFLLEHYSLSIKDVQVHEELCAKTTGEGKTVYNAMLPLLNKK